ncbi:MAG: vWA domain-containing protein [Myxococcota bacterium]
MKRLVTILAVIGLLIGAAIYYSASPDADPNPGPPTADVPDDEPEEPEHKPSTDATSQGTLTLNSSVSHGYLKNGANNDVYAAVDIEARAVEGGERPALNLAVVIDRSGSMNGEKIANARRAANQLVESLSSKDRLAIVSYGSHAQVHVSSQRADTAGKAHLRRAISGIGASGGTNIGAGLRLGSEQVSSASDDDSVNRIILLSDGHPTVGHTSVSALGAQATSILNRGISLTTMGVGLDYNEDLMAALADKGAGNYYFVDESQAAMAFFEKEFDGLAATVARNTSLVIKLPESVSMEKLYGFEHKRSGQRIMVPLAEFHSAEEKNILIRLSADAARLGQVDVLDVSLSYDDTVEEKPGHQAVKLTSVVTDDASKFEEAVNTDVIARVEQVEVAESMKAAMSAYQAGEQEEAQRVLQERRAKMADTQRRYRMPAKTKKKFDRVDKELEDTMGLVGAESSSSDEGKRAIKKNKARGRMILMEKSAF